MRKKSKNSKLRLGVQILFFSLILIFSVNHTLSESGKGISFLSSASTHALCPFGGVVSIYQVLVSGTFVKKVHESSFILMWIVFFSALLFGPLFCGWVCPFGSFQEWLSKIGRKIIGKKYNHIIPDKADRLLRFLRYAVLLWVIYITAVSGQLMFANLDPYYALFNFWTGEVTIQAFVLLFLVIAVSMFVERPFCKYFCPYGAVLGIFNLIRIFPVRRNKATCVNCSQCDRACPMNIKVSETEKVRHHQCISCMKCTTENSCPVNSTVEVSVMNPDTKNRIKLTEKTAAVYIVLIFIIGIGGTMSFNLWHTETQKTPVKYTSGEVEGEYNPADIRGSYTLGDVSKLFGIPLNFFVESFGLEWVENPSEMKIKEFEDIFKETEGFVIETDTIRYLVAVYLDLPYEPEEDTAVPSKAFSLLKQQGLLNEEETVEMRERMIKLEDILVDNPETVAEEEHEEESEEMIVKGNTTFADLMNWGVSKKQIEEILGASFPAPGMTVRDYCSQNEIAFSEVKTEFQELIGTE